MGRQNPSVFVTIAAAAVLLLPGLIFFSLRLAAPFTNDLLQPGSNSITSEGIIVSPVDAAPAALLPGDLVTHIAGRPLEAWAQDVFGPSGDRPRWQVGERVVYRVIRAGQPVDVELTLGQYPLGQIFRRSWGMMVFALVFFGLAAYVLARRPMALAAHLLFVSGAAVVSATSWSFGMQASDLVHPAGFWLFHVTTILAYMIFWLAGLHFFLEFPRPLLPAVPRGRLMAALYVPPYLALLIYLAVTRQAADSTLGWIRLWEPTTGLHAAVTMTLILLAVTWQYRSHRQGILRQQMRWLIWGVAVSGGLGLVLYLLPPLFGQPAVNPNLMGVIILAFPAALVVAILRHNLFDIDTLLNRTLVYGALSALIIGLYILVVSLLGAIFQARGSLLIGLVATGLVAVLVHPLRERLQRRVNRLMFGERDDPVTVFSNLGRQLESAAAPENILPALVETISQTLKLPYVAILWHSDEPEPKIAAEYGKPAAQTVPLPLVYQGERVGTLLVAQRSEDEAFSDAEMWMLRNVARQAGSAVHVVRLSADLRQSRQRIISAREEERRRLRRDLHDGLGPSLAAHILTVGSARAVMHKDLQSADHLLEQLENNLDGLLADVRRLVHNLRPPILDQLGFAGAVESCAAEYAQNGLDITVEMERPFPQLPAAVEVAAYYILREGLSNVVRHAGAQHCQVKLCCGQDLRLTIRDDGAGLAPEYQAGVGLISMRERAAELGGACAIRTPPGGGTEIAVQFPLTP
jgi:two-component system, NarL family, sensor kinase